MTPDQARRKRLRAQEQSARPPQHYVRRDFRPDDSHLPPVPEDTRSLDARLCGDPMPGRSALDRRTKPKPSPWS